MTERRILLADFESGGFCSCRLAERRSPGIGSLCTCFSITCFRARCAKVPNNYCDVSAVVGLMLVSDYVPDINSNTFVRVISSIVICNGTCRENCCYLLLMLTAV